MPHTLSRVLFAALALLLIAPQAWADFITVQPIQVLSDDGATKANSEQTLFPEVANKIYAQAGVKVRFLEWNTVQRTDFLVIDSTDEFAEMTFGDGNGQHPDPNTINMFFVREVLGSYGVGWLDDNGIAIADAVFNFNGGVGRIDTISHEIGHNLGLGHNNYGAGDPNNVMTSGGARDVPSSLNDIYPDGNNLSRLTAAQVDVIRQSRFFSQIVMPEPGSTVILAFASMGILFRRRRR